MTGLDNLSAGTHANLAGATANPHFRLFENDLADLQATSQALGKCELVFHLAADPEVQAGAQNPSGHFEQNLQATFILLEATRQRNVRTRLVFASTSTVYGEPSAIPTPEGYGPLLPISVYGATKLGCEALLSSYTQLLPLQVTIFRFANVVGPRATHGVVYDFIKKLQKNPQELEVLGDGTQSKSYLHIDDCSNAFIMALEEKFWQSPVEVYNIGTEGQTNVLKIAQIVTNAMRLDNVAIKTTSGPNGRAWPGDVKKMQLDITKIKKQGWKPNLNSEQSVRLVTEQLISELRMMNSRRSV